MIGKINKQVARLESLITELLDVTRINSGKMSFQEDWFDFDNMLDEVVEELQFTCQSHQIKVQGEPVGKLWADRFRITQAIINLVTNAIKYSPNAEEVIVRTTVTEDVVQVCVKDDGIGIAAENQGKLFSPFYRVTGSNETMFAGLGLGLYITSEIIRQQEGRIWVESEIGQGSTFCFQLLRDRRLNRATPLTRNASVLSC